MTEDWTHTRNTKHDKACVLRSTVEHNDASDHLNWSGRNREDQEKTLRNVPSTEVIAPTRKARKNSNEELTDSSPRTHVLSAHADSLSKSCRYVRPSPNPQKARVVIGSSVPGPGRRSGPRSLHLGMRVADARANADALWNIINSDTIKVPVPLRLSLV